MSPHRRLHIIDLPGRRALVTLTSGTAAAPSKTRKWHERSPEDSACCTSNRNIPASESLMSFSHSTIGALVSDATITEPLSTSIRLKLYTPLPSTRTDV